MVSTRHIKIIGRDPADEHFNAAHKAIDEAEYLAILGFGFDETNIENLRLAELAKFKPIIATGYGFGAGKRAWIESLGLDKITFGRPTDKVDAVLEKSAFFQWANTSNRRADEMYAAIYSTKRMLPEGD